MHMDSTTLMNLFHELLIIIWASHEQTCLMPYVNNKGADQPAHPCSLISAFVLHCLDSIMYILAISTISSLYRASVAEQTGWSLMTWLNYCSYLQSYRSLESCLWNGLYLPLSKIQQDRYCTNPKYSDTQKIAVIILKFKQYSSTIE